MTAPARFATVLVSAMFSFGAAAAPAPSGRTITLLPGVGNDAANRDGGQ